MICDQLGQARKYEPIHPRFAEAFRALVRSDLRSLPEGRHEVDGESLYLLIARNDGLPKTLAVLESHRRYIDIQFVIEGTDTMGWKPARECRVVSKEYDADRDVMFYGDVPATWLEVRSGMFAIFFPDDAHAPLVSEGRIHKAIVKVAVGHPAS
ncbi:MAG: YhcH/YjgK/YiaL family protein [Bacteroidota bacterium]